MATQTVATVSYAAAMEESYFWGRERPGDREEDEAVASFYANKACDVESIPLAQLRPAISFAKGWLQRFPNRSN